MKKLIILISILHLMACKTITSKELAWQSLHLIDIAQTMNAASSDPCYYENFAVTRALIGPKPDRDAVFMWGALWGVSHYLLSDKIESSNFPKWVKNAWGTLSISATGLNVVNNHSLGVRPWGDNTKGRDYRVNRCLDDPERWGYFDG